MHHLARPGKCNARLRTMNVESPRKLANSPPLPKPFRHAVTILVYAGEERSNVPMKVVHCYSINLNCRLHWFDKSTRSPQPLLSAEIGRNIILEPERSGEDAIRDELKALHHRPRLIHGPYHHRQSICRLTAQNTRTSCQYCHRLQFDFHLPSWQYKRSLRASRVL